MQALKYGQLLFMAVSGLVLMSGCQKPATTEDKTKVVETSKLAQASIDTSQQGSSKVAESTTPVTRSQAPAVSAEKVDLSQAHDINQDKDLSYLGLLFLAQTTKQMTDEQKLALVSADYANEHNEFKKRDLIPRLLPQINQQIDKYKGVYIAKIPIYFEQLETDKFFHQQKEKNLSSLSISSFGSDNVTPYDFNNKTFSMHCELDNLLIDDGYKVLPFSQNKQGVRLRLASSIGSDGHKTVAEPKEKCELQVADEAIARKIEEAKTKHTLGVNGVMYVQITANDYELMAKPIQASVNYLNSQTNEPFITKEFHW